jgi:nucleotide-binding universal stress UspA family protein
VTEFSASSIRALEYALSLAEEANARLILLHAIEDILGDAGAQILGHLNVPEYYHQLAQDAVTRLRAVVPDDARLWARPEERVLKGRAYQEILKVVAEERVDLVVMGVQGKGVVNRLVLGSTTHRVIPEASYPVLTLHSGSVAVQ